MLKPKQSVILVIGLLLAMITAYYITSNVLICLIGCLAIVLYVMADMFVIARKGNEAETRQIALRKKRSLIVVGILGTIAVVALTAIIITYFTGAIQFV